jgi:chemotaxis protein methyltransferase CheR
VLLDFRIPASELIRQLATQPLFLERVVKRITVNTTEMFRDPPVWVELRKRILTDLARKEKIKIWHAGCSTGQEVYSMAILLTEMNLLDKTEIYASDLNADVLETARQGAYKYRFNIGYLDNFEKVIRAAGTYPATGKEELYRKYFDIDVLGDRIRIHPSLLDKPLFFKHDLVTETDLPAMKFDLVVCRNVIIYFNYNLQNKIFDLFYNKLHDNGTLWLGVHESIHGDFSSKFVKQGYFYEKF